MVRVEGPGGGRFLVHDIPLGRDLTAAVAEEITGDRADGSAELFRDSSERTVPEFINGADEIAGRAG